MKEYIIKVASAAILAAFSDIIAPRTWQKYINILTNSILLLVLISPVLSLKGISLPSFEGDKIEIMEYNAENEILDTLKLRIEEDIEDRLKDEFNYSFKATVTLDKSDLENVRVKEIKLFPKPSKEIKDRLFYIYECESVK